ncbi:penicillin-binding protein [Jatrophihabitans telluris]|uniref:Penicillin-binding protein n=1 Tax=Jatrophihabitans telluris TaxID=2038343 RepID=A0ABY4QYN1_9ACTN|nr:transglycosylase domain-containing protein [Jatrophihabitans telluris]UQX88529.1 penicillin-binding protein [Jatrophihabitans telluris]
MSDDYRPDSRSGDRGPSRNGRTDGPSQPGSRAGNGAGKRAHGPGDLWGAKPGSRRAKRAVGPTAAELAAMNGWKRRRALKKRRIARMSTGKRVSRRIGVIATSLLAVFALLFTVAAIGVYKVVNVPSPDSLNTSQTAQLLYSDGTPIASITGGENRTSVPLSKVPEHVRSAVIAAEDRGFYSEPGISIRGTLRAVLNDIKGGSVQGGSTITQQYVKNAYLSSDQTLGRKVKEAAIALKLSREYSKDTILENYLNTIYFGRGAYGIQAAAKAYFGVNVQQLTVSQGALLAAVIKSPEYYDPRITPTAAKDRWGYVVDGMVSIGKLSQTERDTLKFPTTIKKAAAKSSALDGPLGLVWTQVKQELADNGIPESEINAKGLRITTTINRTAESDAIAAVKSTFANLSPQQKKDGTRPALVAVNPANGGVVAYYGNSTGTDFDYANGYRPPGSSFKPYTLATALQQNVDGKNAAYAISSTVNGSSPQNIAGTVVNNDPSDLQYSSPAVRVDFAMKVSLNTVFDAMANKVGPDNVRDMAIASGIRDVNGSGKKTLIRKDGTVSFGIGIGDADYAVRPVDQANGFATIANGGTAHKTFFVAKVADAQGNVLYRHKVSGSRAMDPKVANDVGLSLKPIADWSLDSLAGGRQSGAKTGTAGIQTGPNAGQNSDAWMVGYTPQLSTAVWVGTGGTKPIHNASGGQEYGRDLPGLTWKAFMDAYLNGQPNEPLPTTQMITKGANIAPSSTKPSSSAPSTTAPSSTAPSTTAPTTTAPAPTPTPTPTPTPSKSCGVLGVICTTTTPPASPTPTTTSQAPQGAATTTPAGAPAG